MKFVAEVVVHTDGDATKKAVRAALQDVLAQMWYVRHRGENVAVTRVRVRKLDLE